MKDGFFDYAIRNPQSAIRNERRGATVSVELETARLRLRPFQLGDLEDLYRLYGDAEVMRYITNGQPRTREDTIAALARMMGHWPRLGLGMWALFDRADGRFIGRCGLQPLGDSTETELGYTLLKEFWGRGIATETARLALRHGFETCGLERIIAIAHPANGASRRVIEKVGFRYEKTGPFKDQEVVWYGFSRDEYRATTAGVCS
jgi:ribosomal-protein-alanine N-acetyltransferase